MSRLIAAALARLGRLGRADRRPRCSSPTSATRVLAGVAVFGTHAAAQLVLLPLFLEGPAFAPLAPRRERLVQSS